MLSQVVGGLTPLIGVSIWLYFNFAKNARGEFFGSRGNRVADDHETRLYEPLTSLEESFSGLPWVDQGSYGLGQPSMLNLVLDERLPENP